MPDPTDALVAGWPLFGIRLTCRDVVLRPARERDLPALAALQPADYEHDPAAEAFPGEDVHELRRRLVHQGYWRSMGTWSPASWCLDLAVEHEGELVGVQSLEAEDFVEDRLVDLGSWLVPSARGRGLGVAMRAAVLGLAFDHLGAVAAVTSARSDNAASLGVSGRLGYRHSGMVLGGTADDPVELLIMRLSVADWQASEIARDVEVSGVEECLSLFGLSPSIEH